VSQFEECLDSQPPRDQLCGERRAASGPAQMSTVTFDAYILFALLMVVSFSSIYLAGRIAEHRGRRFKIWAWIAAIIGPLALPLVFLFPNLHGKVPAVCEAHYG
jgi:MFS family permease